ncbi:hypothetical protein HanIR_Chr13g0643071 [Helianthus annuus]|nr:hypothetical protein HanIR_Chr13g0643071 [Helianthus annuus]
MLSLLNLTFSELPCEFLGQSIASVSLQGLAVTLLWDEARHQTSGKLTTSYYILILMELDNVVSSFQSSQVTLIYQGLWID